MLALEDRLQVETLTAGTEAVPFDLMLVHTDHATRTLDDYRDAIFTEVDRMAMRVGKLLWEAKQAHPKTFDVWVRDDLPFGADTARRLIAIYRAYAELPEATVARLPRPWQAMFALRQTPPAELEAAMDRGEIGPAMTVREAVSWAQRRAGVKPMPRRADALVGALLRYDAVALHPLTREALGRWLSSAVRPSASPGDG